MSKIKIAVNFLYPESLLYLRLICIPAIFKNFGSLTRGLNIYESERGGAGITNPFRFFYLIYYGTNKVF